MNAVAPRDNPPEHNPPEHDPPEGNRTVLWLDPGFGASGDMLLGALVGLGVDVDRITTSLQGLAVAGWTLNASRTTRAGLSAHRVEVEAESGPARHWSDIDALLAGADLPEVVRSGARATFRALGEIEAEAHDMPIERVHFHEVGAVDAIVDIVGTWVAVHALGVDRVVVGPVGLGHGTVGGSHGRLPLPAPATAALLAGAVVRPLDIELETCTPTGAALLATLGSWGPLPAGTLLRSARGAGRANPRSHPNVVSAHLLDVVAGPGAGAPSDDSEDAVVLTTNLDDVTPEILAYVVERTLEAGANDAWIVPIIMKKGRPGHQLCVLCTPDRAPALRALVSAETGSLGIRQIAAKKFPLPRTFEPVEVLGASVTIKSGPHGSKPEFDDVAALARKTGRPFREIDQLVRSHQRDIPGSGSHTG